MEVLPSTITLLGRVLHNFKSRLLADYKTSKRQSIAHYDQKIQAPVIQVSNYSQLSLLDSAKITIMLVCSWNMA